MDWTDKQIHVCSRPANIHVCMYVGVSTNSYIRCSQSSALLTSVGLSTYTDTHMRHGLSQHCPSCPQQFECHRDGHTGHHTHTITQHPRVTRQPEGRPAR